MTSKLTLGAAQREDFTPAARNEGVSSPINSVADRTLSNMSAGNNVPDLKARQISPKSELELFAEGYLKAHLNPPYEDVNKEKESLELLIEKLGNRDKEIACYDYLASIDHMYLAYEFAKKSPNQKELMVKYGLVDVSDFKVVEADNEFNVFLDNADLSGATAYVNKGVSNGKISGSEAVFYKFNLLMFEVDLAMERNDYATARAVVQKVRFIDVRKEGLERIAELENEFSLIQLAKTPNYKTARASAVAIKNDKLRNEVLQEIGLLNNVELTEFPEYFKYNQLVMSKQVHIAAEYLSSLGKNHPVYPSLWFRCNVARFEKFLEEGDLVNAREILLLIQFDDFKSDLISSFQKKMEPYAKALLTELKRQMLAGEEEEALRNVVDEPLMEVRQSAILLILKYSRLHSVSSNAVELIFDERERQKAKVQYGINQAADIAEIEALLANDATVESISAIETIAKRTAYRDLRRARLDIAQKCLFELKFPAVRSWEFNAEGNAGANFNALMEQGKIKEAVIDSAGDFDDLPKMIYRFADFYLNKGDLAAARVIVPNLSSQECYAEVMERLILGYIKNNQIDDAIEMLEFLSKKNEQNIKARILLKNPGLPVKFCAALVEGYVGDKRELNKAFENSRKAARSTKRG